MFIYVINSVWSIPHINISFFKKKFFFLFFVICDRTKAIRTMAKVWSHFLVMFWVLFIISSGIYLFSRGFLLSRRVQINFTECTRLKICDSNESEVRESFEPVIRFQRKETTKWFFVIIYRHRIAWIRTRLMKSLRISTHPPNTVCHENLVSFY